jgi:hypothetical protein
MKKIIIFGLFTLIFLKMSVEYLFTKKPEKRVFFRKAEHKIPDGFKLRECDVPCYVKPRRGINSDLQVSVEGRTESFRYSMEGIAHYSQLRQRSSHHFGLATTSFKSDIPLPYFSWSEYNIKTPPVDFHEVIHGVSFAARNCASLNDREKWVKGLQDIVRVDSMSSCLHNAEWPRDILRSNKAGMMRKYLFHLAFENECSEDYVTEKVWGALSSGTVPIYYGAPNILDHVPEHSVINVADFDSVESLGRYLKFLMNDEQEYNRYHEWRFKDYSDEFKAKFRFTYTHSECRACRMVFADIHGLIFDHDTQEIRH